ncbi:MAG TPA: DUF3006 domain-containing protein [Bacillota bacterium]|nr:DUF3006 domain-containing protein [Bacillota bacterium]
MHGVLDRFSDNDMAVILIESINKEIHVPIHKLPQGSVEQTWFHIKECHGTYQIDSIDKVKTEHMQQKSTSLQDKLQAKMKRSKYKK